MASFIKNESQGDGIDIYNEGGEITASDVNFSSESESESKILVFIDKDGSYNGSKDNILKT